jgi:hypothetical protein
MIRFLPFYSSYLIITPENCHKIIKFNIGNSAIERLEVLISARLVPYNYLTDYIGGLGIALNKQLPATGEFGMPLAVSNYFKNKENTLKAILSRILWYAPRYYEGSKGLSGDRVIWFDNTNFKVGMNELTITSCDNKSGTFPSLGDAIIIKNIRIKAYGKVEGERNTIFILNK